MSGTFLALFDEKVPDTFFRRCAANLLPMILDLWKQGKSKTEIGRELDPQIAKLEERSDAAATARA